MKPSTRAFLGGAAVFAVISFVSVQTPAQQKVAAERARPAAGFDQPESVPARPVLAPADGAAPSGGGTAKPGRTAPGGGNDDSAASHLECAAGRNGGATDKGVTANRIHLAATEVRSGPGSSFLGSSHAGMEAVVAAVNAQGGICGRLLDLDLRDDGWDAALGATFLQNFANDGKYFALPVVPSSEGLTQAIRTGVIDKAGIPVVGTDGMLKEQYQDPWVWPVATATASTMRIMARYAYDALGARQFGIVYDSRYKFGKEGAQAFRDFVATLPGAKMGGDVGVLPNQPSYAEVEAFNSQCGPTRRCQFVAMLLEPSAALSWINSMGDDAEGRRLGFGSLGTAGAQPLFNAAFARECGAPCDGMLLWTGYNPPIGERRSLPGVAKYVADVRAVDPGADATNQFVQGAYLGMSVLVDALRKVGPELTRARLRDALNTLDFSSDLSSPLSWRAGRHSANAAAQGFVIRAPAGSFAGFADAGTGWVADPRPGAFPKGVD